MIVATDGLARLFGAVTMADGGFDPLHPGHVEYLDACARLGLPVLCNVAADDWVARKHPPLLTQRERVALIDAMRMVAYVHPSTTTTAEVLRRLGPRYYAKGADWDGRLPAEELSVCAASGTEIVYLETVRGSSSAIVDRFMASLGIADGGR